MKHSAELGGLGAPTAMLRHPLSATEAPEELVHCTIRVCVPDAVVHAADGDADSCAGVQTLHGPALHATTTLGHMKRLQGRSVGSVCGPHSASAAGSTVPLTSRTQLGEGLRDTPRLVTSLALVMQSAEQGLQKFEASQNAPRHGSGSHFMTEGGGTRPRPTHSVWPTTAVVPLGDTSTHCTVRPL